MKTLDTIDLASVTGGIFTPCARFQTLPVSQATSMDLAIAKVNCHLKLPTATEINRAKEIRFEVPVNGR